MFRKLLHNNVDKCCLTKELILQNHVGWTYTFKDSNGFTQWYPRPGLKNWLQRLSQNAIWVNLGRCLFQWNWIQFKSWIIFSACPFVFASKQDPKSISISTFLLKLYHWSSKPHSFLTVHLQPPRSPIHSYSTPTPAISNLWFTRPPNQLNY